LPEISSIPATLALLLYFAPFHPTNEEYMKKLLMLLTIALTCLSLFAATAEAKRFGGGSSFGKQRTMAPQQAQRSPAAAPAPAPAGNKWLGPLAGLAIGAGLGAMFAGGLGGMGGAMGNILMALLAAGVVMFLISKFRKPQAAMQYAGAGAPLPGASTLSAAIRGWQRRASNRTYPG